MKLPLLMLAAAVGASAEERLTRMEEKLDRIERLLDAVFGEEFERIERLKRTPGLMEAIRHVERRYKVAGISEALASVDPGKLSSLQWRLGAAINRTDPARLREDDSFRVVIVEVMSRTEAQRRPGGYLVSAMGRRDPTLLTLLLPDLFDRRGGREVALIAAGLAKGEEVADMVRARLPRLSDPRHVAMAYAALLAQGEEGALQELRKAVKAVNDDNLVDDLAVNLRRRGKPAAMWLYLELLKSNRKWPTGLRELSLLKEGKPGEIKKLRSDWAKLYEEYSGWLEENYSRIRFDRTRRMFVLGGDDF